LDQRANQLAHYLRKQDTGTETIVGVCMERSLEMVVALLGILKSGAAYLPLDPTYPESRLQHMLAEARVRVVLTQQRWLSKVPSQQSGVVSLDTQWTEHISHLSSDNPTPLSSVDNPAYAIYTSGSTGKPKAALNTHRGIVNRLLWMQEAYQLTAEDRVLQKTPFTFDVSVWEFFWPLLNGARLVMARPGGHQDTAYLAQLISERGITIVHFVPSMLQVFLEQSRVEACESLRHVICSGEALRYELQERFFNSLGAKLHNLYGPTEAAVDVTYWECQRGSKQTIVPIGRPIANLQMYVLDRQMQAVPLGVAGELYIGGTGVGRGYLHRADLTAERFVPDPFRSNAGARLYRTGDLGRYLPDGAIEFLGRIDHQVKVRGQRIELGEIEIALVEHESVSDAVVVARDERLIAYVVSRNGDDPPVTQLRDHLQQSLPDYMIPSAFVTLESLPLTSSGKVDRKALPEPDLTRSVSVAAYVAPRTPEEELIAGIWSELLGVGPIGIKDNFFALGGHSLLATRVMSRLMRSLGIELPIRALFESPTVESLAQIVAKSRQQRTAPPLQKISHEQPPLSFAQQRLWFLDQLEPESALYNIPSAVRLTGPLNIKALQQSFNEIARRHESLRTSFRTIDGQPVQMISEPVPLPICIVDLKGPGKSERELRMVQLLKEEAQRPFDLAHGPLIRCTLFQLDNEENVLSVVMHHIISDGGSISILIDELQTLYEAYVHGRESVVLPELPVQYADYAQWQRRWLQGEVLEVELGYWRYRLAGAPPNLDIPTDHPRAQLRSTRGGIVEMKVDPELVTSLRTLARSHDGTLFMVLMAVWQLLLSRYSGQADVSVGTPVAGRTQPELERLIGFFVNTLVIRTDLSEVHTFAKLLERVREACLGAYQHQSIPFEKVVEELAPERSLGRTPLFQVMLVLQNDVQGLRLSGLEAEEIYVGGQTAKFDLTLTFGEEKDGGLRGVLEYSTELFEERTAARLVGHLQRCWKAWWPNLKEASGSCRC
jgi:amino acid adenylation domain-containing protein